jgi:hypothetical protein
MEYHVHEMPSYGLNFFSIELYTKTFTQMFYFHTFIEAFLIENKKISNFKKVLEFFTYL